MLTSTSRIKNHYPIETKINLTTSSNTKIKLENKRFNFKKADWKSFQSFLAEKSQHLIQSNDPITITNQLTTAIIEAANKSIPKINFSSRYKKELPEEIINLIKHRRKIRRN